MRTKVKRSGGLVLIRMREFKELKNLSQLDRIEFRQKYNNIGWHLDLLPICSVALIIAVIFGVNNDIETAVSFIHIVFFALAIHIFFMLLNVIISKIQKRKLFEEYFEIKPRGKSK